MVVHDFISAATKLEVLTHVGFDDYADRLNFQITVCILMVFSMATTMKTYFLNPIFCYLPNIVGSHEGQSSYVNNYCYTEGTYNVPPDDFKIDIHNRWMETHKDKKIYYYQWLPFLIGVQGVMFCVPRMLWHLFVSNRAGSDLAQLIRVANDAGRADGEKREKLTKHVVRQLELWLHNTREVSVGSFKTARRKLYSVLSVCLPSKRLGTWLVFVYFFVKCLFAANLVCQLLTMGKVLQLDSSVQGGGRSNKSLFSLAATFGPDLLSELVNGRDWHDTGLFPRSGVCAVRLRQSAGSNYLFAQCALPVNMIHEKIFIFLWFWYVAVLLLTLLSIALWCGRLLVGSRRSRLPRKYLHLAGLLTCKNRDELATVDDFVAKFLRHDGALMLHMLALNCGDVITTEICADLYRTYRENYQHQDLRDPLANGEAFAVNLSHSSVALSPRGNPAATSTTQRRRRRSNSGCGGCDKRQSGQCGVVVGGGLEPSAPLIEDGTAAQAPVVSIQLSECSKLAL